MHSPCQNVNISFLTINGVHMDGKDANIASKTKYGKHTINIMNDNIDDILQSLDGECDWCGKIWSRKQWGEEQPENLKNLIDAVSQMLMRMEQTIESIGMQAQLLKSAYDALIHEGFSE